MRKIKPISFLQANLRPPGDKSISHRAVLLTSLAKGISRIENLSLGADVLSSMRCMEQLGVSFRWDAGVCMVDSPGQEAFRQPDRVLDCGNSGTTMRLLAGVLAGGQLSATLVGDASLSKRPMLRVVDPLRAMGATIMSATPPLEIKGAPLRAIDWQPHVASAQVKSAILLAGLNAVGETKVREIYPTRDHTERMLKLLGANIAFESGHASVSGGGDLRASDISVPGDISSAAFFAVLAAMVPGARLTIADVGLNQGRTGILEVLKAMGAKVWVEVQDSQWEPVGTVIVEGSSLNGFEISGALVPRLIDEVPALAVAACLAEGRSVIRDAAELRAKESDRISQLLSELRKMGAKCEEYADGFTIEGGYLKGAVVDSHGDHRLAMALAVAGLLAQGETVIAGSECVDISYPAFWADLESMRRDGNG